MVSLLSDRMKRVLEIIVEDYITSAEPVGSKAVSMESALLLSPASIRGVMAELEEMGLVYQPHTSAGRIPTEKGFRFYVDFIVDVHELGDRERQLIRSRFASLQTETGELFREASRILSSSSRHLGVVWAPRTDLVVLQHIEFVKLKKHLILALLVSTSGMVQNRIVEVEEDYSQSDLDSFSEYLNGLLSGLTLRQVREKILEQMRLEKMAYDHLFDEALKLSQKALSSVGDADVFIDGRTNILEEPEFSSLSQMRDLFRAFEEKATMIRLLDTCLEPQGVKIAIGSESQIREMETCSLITSTYSFGGKVLGALGVIGPRRMNYSKVIPLVDYTAKLVTEILETQ
jgi:heat-inducible transcriptional repressor